MNDLSAFERWMKLVGEYGLSYAFLACTVLILLYVAVTVVGLFKKWVPRWFESSIQSHERVAKAVEQQCDLLECIHEHTHATRSGAKHAVRAAKAYKELPSAVMVHFTNAADALDERVPNHHDKPARQD